MPIFHYLRLLFLLIDGSSTKGIRNRTWFAISMSILAIATDTAYVYFAYDYIPRSIPVLRDWDNAVMEWSAKSSFLEYEVERIIVLAVMLACGYAITIMNRESIIAKRTRCLLAETAMLIITTGVGLSIAEITLALGEAGELLSDYWEWSIMLFWFAVSLAEYIIDYMKLKKKLTYVKKE